MRPISQPLLLSRLLSKTLASQQQLQLHQSGILRLGGINFVSSARITKRLPGIISLSRFNTTASLNESNTPRTSSSAGNSASTPPYQGPKIRRRELPNFIKNMDQLSRKGTAVVSKKSVGYWLLASAGLVFGIVVLGGLTRLTESGLSITEWKPITGALPPRTEEDWQAEFDKYRLSPEYKILNSHMDLDDFKFIYYMEWGHRLWGRLIGITFVLPAAYFMLTRRTNPRTSRLLIFTAGLIGFQGFIGWWMVKSGLDKDNFQTPGSHPRVSQYRLTTHLAAAFIVYSQMIWLGLEILRENRWIKNPAESIQAFKQLSNPALRPFKQYTIALLGLVFFTAMTGGFVAGLDAGLIYNEFPYMGKSIMPPKKELFDPHYSRDPQQKDLIWRNLLENPTTVQFIHRVSATTTFVAVTALHVYSNILKRRGVLPRAAWRAGAAVMGIATLQVTLGISALIYMMPTPVAAAHQAGSLALLTSVLVLAARLKNPRLFMKLVIEQAAKQQKKRAAAAAVV